MFFEHVSVLNSQSVLRNDVTLYALESEICLELILCFSLVLGLGHMIGCLADLVAAMALIPGLHQYNGRLYISNILMLNEPSKNASTVEPLTNDHPHQRPSLSYDHISCDGQWFLFVCIRIPHELPSLLYDHTNVILRVVV